MKKLGIVAHSAEGAALCFRTACHEGESEMGAHMHPHIVLSAVPMGLSLEAWENDNYDEIAKFLRQGVEDVAAAGADFFICPDNTAHLVLDRIASRLPLPGLHIAAVVCREIRRQGWSRVGLLGTRWTMTGPVYPAFLEESGQRVLIPPSPVRQQLNDAIFDELCQGIFREQTRDMFLAAIQELKNRGADCVILGCTEIPLIVDAENSPLPVLDSTRLLARHAVLTAIRSGPISQRSGWLTLPPAEA